MRAGTQIIADGHFHRAKPVNERISDSRVCTAADRRERVRK